MNYITKKRWSDLVINAIRSAHPDLPELKVNSVGSLVSLPSPTKVLRVSRGGDAMFFQMVFYKTQEVHLETTIKQDGTTDIVLSTPSAGWTIEAATALYIAIAQLLVTARTIKDTIDDKVVDWANEEATRRV